MPTSQQTNLPCSNCGAQLSFGPGTRSLICGSCGAENEIPPEPDGPWGGGGIEELDYRAALRNQLDASDVETTVTLSCPGCGAEVSLDEGTQADQCPFCATPLSRSAEHPHRHPKPGAVLPFALTEREARERMKTWLGSLWFAPSKLTQYAEAGRPISGVYLPHYTYDAAGEAAYQGARGDAYYVTRTRTVTVDGKTRQETYQERRIRWTQVSGRVARFFDDVLVPASETMGPMGDRAQAAGHGWELAALEPYRPEYLAGFRAEAPAVPLDQGFAAAKGAMESVLRRDIRFDIGGDEQRISHMTARFDRITFKHVLLPVWLAAYRWRNKPYRVVVNGRTGQVSGERPYSAWKIAIAVALGLIVAAGIGYLVALEQGIRF
ncbi:MAG: primosomal protein N' (replication factor Y) - superfamily II helicase [Pseudomonadota bacterium]